MLNDKVKKESDQKSWALAWGVLGAAGIQLAIAVVGGLYLGSLADEHWKTGSVFTLVGLVVGAVGGFVNLLRLLNYRQRRLNNGS